MATGTVKWFSDDEGVGFITPDDWSKDLLRAATSRSRCFAHQTAVVGDGYRSLVEGARVFCDAEIGDKGPKAVNVQLVKRFRAYRA